MRYIRSEGPNPLERAQQDQKSIGPGYIVCGTKGEDLWNMDGGLY
jgi:hypothetical protein